MSKVVLIPNGEKIYAVPTEVCEKYELQGEDLESLKEQLEQDVEGQSSRIGEQSSSSGTSIYSGNRPGGKGYY